MNLLQKNMQHKKYAVSSIAISLDEINYGMIYFDNVEAKEVDVTLDCHQKNKFDHQKTQAKHPSNSTKHYTKQTRCQTRIP